MSELFTFLSTCLSFVGFLYLITVAVIVDYKFEKNGLYDRLEERRYQRKLRKEEEKKRKLRAKMEQL